MIISLFNNLKENNIQVNQEILKSILAEYKKYINNLKKMFDYPKISDYLSDDFEKIATEFENRPLRYIRESLQPIML